LIWSSLSFSISFIGCIPHDGNCKITVHVDYAKFLQYWNAARDNFVYLSMKVRMMVTVKITVHVDYAKLFQYWNAARDNFIIYNPPFV
jgi:hypothetical protein